MNKKNLWDLMIGMRVNPAASTELLGRLFGPGHKVVLEECSRTCYLFGPADSPPTGLPASPMRGLAYLPDGLTKQGRQLASWCYDWDAVAEAAQLIDDQMNWNRHAALGPAGVWPQHWGGLRVEDKVRTRYVAQLLQGAGVDEVEESNDEVFLDYATLAPLPNGWLVLYRGGSGEFNPVAVVLTDEEAAYAALPPKDENA